MRTVRDEDGRTFLVVKESGESTLVRDPETGAEEFRPNERLTTVDDESGLAVAAGAVPPAVRRILSATHDDRSLGLLVELAGQFRLAHASGRFGRRHLRDLHVARMCRLFVCRVWVFCCHCSTRSPIKYTPTKFYCSQFHF